MQGFLGQNGVQLKSDIVIDDLYEKIYQTPSGKRPDPSSYLSPAYIQNWESSWSDGAVRFVKQSDIQKLVGWVERM